MKEKVLFRYVITLDILKKLFSEDEALRKFEYYNSFRDELNEYIQGLRTELKDSPYSYIFLLAINKDGVLYLKATECINGELPKWREPANRFWEFAQERINGTQAEIQFD